MATPEQIMDGISDRLATIDGLRTLDYVPGSITPPVAVVAPPEEIAYDLVYRRGADRLTFTIWALVSKAEERGAWKNLARYLAPSGDTSVKAAIEGDVTLAGAVDSLRVTRAFNVGQFTVGGIEYLGANWEVDVIS